MHVSAFMIPAEQVITLPPTASIKEAMDLMLNNHVGAIVVLVTGTYHVPIGIVTKTDLIKAYQEDLTVDHQVKEIMSKDLATVFETQSRDQAARVMEKHRHHHALVVDKNSHFKGLISSWDITVECAKDDRAWPWNRSEDGRFHMPNELKEQELLSTSPTSTTESGLLAAATDSQPKNVRPVVRRSQMGDSFRAYVDNLGYFD